MKILIVGGGSGGHVSPAIAVAAEIRKKHPRCELEFWTDKKCLTIAESAIAGAELEKVRLRKIAAGKLRRYTNFGFWDYIEHFDVVLRNVVDGFRLLAGFMTAFGRLLRNRPDVIFLKGGYVCLAVGFAARVLKVPYIIHDSDAMPGLTNRLLAGRATKIATGMPLKYYKYPAEKAEWTGIPISNEFKAQSMAEQSRAKAELGFDPERPLLMITGGSLGAEHINSAVREILPELLKLTNVYMITGKERYAEMAELEQYQKPGRDGKSRFVMVAYSNEMAKLFAAADMIVSRAGASTMTELAAMHKAVIIVPNHKLPGFHQVKNAETFVAEQAAIMIRDEALVDQPGLLLKEVKRLVSNPEERARLGENLGQFARSGAAKRLAELVTREASRRK